MEFVATKGTDVARGFFEWSPVSPISGTFTDGAGNGKTLWQIAGGISLNGSTIQPVTSVILEVINNMFIAAPAPNSLIGDRYTRFGTASPGSGLQSVQNFRFRDESGLLLSSIEQPLA